MLKRKYQVPGTLVYLIDDEAEAIEDASILFPLKKGNEYMIVGRREGLGSHLVELHGFPGDWFSTDLFSPVQPCTSEPIQICISDLFEAKVKQLQDGKH